MANSLPISFSLPVLLLFFYSIFIISSSAFIISASTSSPSAPFDINEAYEQLMYSYSAYCNQSQLWSWDCYFCQYNGTVTQGFKVTAVVEYEKLNVFGYIGYKDDTVEVVFRGTQAKSLPNWVDDIDFSHVEPYPNVMFAFVHGGFFDAYESVKTEVRAAVTQLVQSLSPSRLVVTGHSLGAALATLCAVDLAPNVSVPVVVYNYGSPRIGNSYFVQYYEALIPTRYRVVNRDDLVPHLPTQSMGFVHSTREVWYKNDTYYEICSATNGEDPTCSDSVAVPLSIEAHLDYFNIPLLQGGCR